MIRRIWEILSMLAVANMVLLILLVVLAIAGGSLTGNRVRMIRDVIAGRPLPVVEVPVPAKPEDELAARANERIERDRAHTQVTQLQIDQQLRELKDFQVQLDQARAALDARIARFDRDRAQWARQRQAERETLESDGFKKALALVESIAPDQAKDLFLAMDDEQVVRLLSRMDERKAAKVVREFQTPSEKARLLKIIERIKHPAAQAAGEEAAVPPEKGQGARG